MCDQEPSIDADLTGLLVAARAGDRQAEQQFFELVNEQLRQLARSVARGDPEVQPTSLVNDAFLRLFRQRDVEVINRKYFFAVAFEEMRRVLRERQRARRALKRGGAVTFHPLDVVLDAYLDRFSRTHAYDYVELDDALQWLKDQPGGARQCEVAVFRVLGGYTCEETAELLDVSTGTVSRDWELARVKLARRLGA